MYINREDEKTEILLYPFYSKKSKLPIGSHTWGKYKFDYKQRYLSLQKKELLTLIEQHPILTSSEKEIEEIENIAFHFRYRPNVQCTFQGSLEGLKKDPCFKENLSHLQQGDVLTFPTLKSWNLSEMEMVSWVSIVIEEANTNQEDVLIQETLQPKEPTVSDQFQANGTHWRIQNISIEKLVKTLTQSRHGKLEVTGKIPSNVDVFFYSPDTNLSKERIYEKVFDTLKRQYKITIREKYKEQTSWFLSGGDPEKINQFTEEKVILNLEYFNQEAQNKGLEPVGPMNYNWFADRYLPMKYDIQVTDLTAFSGRYILPLKSKSLKSLQKQLKKDYGLVLKQQKRTVPIRVVRFE